MAVTPFQSEVLKRIARSRIDGGETYIAGGLALNHQLRRPRVSSDIDVFNSSYSALERAADHEDELLGLTLHPFDLATNKLLALAGRRVPRVVPALPTATQRSRRLKAVEFSGAFTQWSQIRACL